MQTQLASTNQSIAMAGIGANMVNGVQGVGLAVFDYALSDILNKPKFSQLDALFNLSTAHPEQLVNSAKLFMPSLQSIPLSDASEPIQLNKLLPIPIALNIDPKVAIRGKHLVVYNCLLYTSDAADE